MNKIEIPINRTKISFLLIGVLIFVIPGVFFHWQLISLQLCVISNPQIIRIVGIVAIVFFGAAGAYGLRNTELFAG